MEPFCFWSDIGYLKSDTFFNRDAKIGKYAVYAKRLSTISANLQAWQMAQFKDGSPSGFGSRGHSCLETL